MSFGFFRRPAQRRATWPSEIDLDGRAVPFSVAVSRRARRLTLRADPAAGEVRLTVPHRTAHGTAMAFVAQQRDWLAARVESWPSPCPIAPGAAISLAEETLVIVWQKDWPRTPRAEAGRLLVGGPRESLAGRIERWLRGAAKAELTTDCAMIAARIGLPPPQVRVGDPRGRWGSCSAAGTLAFSWRLIMAPTFVRRAVAAHEVAHLVHHDHSPRFHALCLELSDGNARRATRWLAANGAALHWVGRA